MSQKESKILKTNAINSLLLAVDHFNRLEDRGRNEAVLILLDHSFELLLKAGILRNGGKIREKGKNETIGFERAIRKALSDSNFLKPEQTLVLQTINSLRDAAQHHYVSLSEEQLYLHAQAGLTLFRDLLAVVFSEELRSYLPDRMLPISTVPVTDSIGLFTSEVEQVKKLLQPGKRQRTEALAKLRGIAIVDNSLRGTFVQPSDRALMDLGKRLTAGESMDSVFPGIGAVTFSTQGEGAKLNLRLTKNEGIAVQVAPVGAEGTPIVAVQRVNDMDFYNLNHPALAKKVGLTGPKTTAAIKILKLKTDAECYREFKFGKSTHSGYSQKAIQKINELLKFRSIDDVWAEYLKIEAEAKKFKKR